MFKVIRNRRVSLLRSHLRYTKLRAWAARIGGQVNEIIFISISLAKCYEYALDSFQQEYHSTSFPHDKMCAEHFNCIRRMQFLHLALCLWTITVSKQNGSK